MSLIDLGRKLAVSGLAAMLVSAPAWSQVNLEVSEFSLNPATPVQGQPVNVRIGVYNRGSFPSGPYRVEWWPGENFATGAACSWNVSGNNPKGGRILSCTYPGYASWYANLNTRVIVDVNNTVDESNEGDNDRRYPIRVLKAVTLAQPDLYISEMSLDPAVPTQGQPVNVRIGVYNRGNAPAGPSRVEWWPGSNYPSPACGWNIGPLVANGGRILTCTYPGYPSWYGQINTKATADVANTVAESDEGNNSRLMRIRVRKP